MTEARRTLRTSAPVGWARGRVLSLLGVALAVAFLAPGESRAQGARLGGAQTAGWSAPAAEAPSSPVRATISLPPVSAPRSDSSSDEASSDDDDRRSSAWPSTPPMSSQARPQRTRKVAQPVVVPGVGDVVAVPASFFGGEGEQVWTAVIEEVELSGDGALTVAQAPQRPPAARAADPAGEAPRKVQVDLMIVYASNEKKGFDPRVARFRNQLQILSYTGFDVLSQESFSLDMGETKKTTLFEGRVVETTLVDGTDKRVHLRMRLLKPSEGETVLLDTTVTVPRKGTFFVGGPSHQRGVLILPVTATY